MPYLPWKSTEINSGFGLGPFLGQFYFSVIDIRH